MFIFVNCSYPYQHKTFSEQHNSNNRPQYDNHTKQGTMNRLIGAKMERGTTMYLRNIRIDDENDDQIFRMIKDHCNYSNVRIMSYKVIRNRYANDCVGCKIVIPLSQEHIVMRPEFWPCEVECRRWEIRQSKQRYNYEYEENYTQKGNRYVNNDESYKRNNESYKRNNAIRQKFKYHFYMSFYFCM